jgi:hypothetical protein
VTRGARGRGNISGVRGRVVLDGPRGREIKEGGRSRQVLTGPRGRVTGGVSNNYEVGDAILLDPATTGYLLIDPSGDKLLIDF